MAKIELDEEQKKVRDTLNNVVVCAGAGAGKTTVLSERFTKLIREEAVGIDEILTLTFTEKAATEMKDRIYKVLKQYSGDEKCKEACKNFDRAHIQTLDSYFSEITKQGAMLYGINPDFQLDDTAVENMVRRLAYEFVYEHKEDPRIKALESDPIKIASTYFAEPVVNYINLAGNYDLVKDVENQVDILKSEFDIIAKSITPNLLGEQTTAQNSDLNPIENPIEVLRKTALEELKQKLEEAEAAPKKLETDVESKQKKLKDAQGVLDRYIESKKEKTLDDKQQEALKKKQEKVTNAQNKLKEAEQKYAAEYQDKVNLKNKLEKKYPAEVKEINDKFDKRISILKNYNCALSLDDIRASKTDAIKNLLFGNDWILEKHADDFPGIKIKREHYYNLWHLLNSVSGYKTVLGIAELLTEFIEEIQNAKKQNGLLTFDDVSNLARKILIEQQVIRKEEKSKYKIIMIDEFQDNNQLQLDILELLAEKDDVFSEVPDMKKVVQDSKNGKTTGKLFFVGDEKQSIYAFRGAQVTVFNHLKNQIQEIHGETLPISTNNRSEAELIAAFNTIFGGYDFNAKQNSTDSVPAPHLNPSLLMTEKWFSEIGSNIEMGIDGKETLKSIPDYEAGYSKVLIPVRKLEYAEKDEDEKFINKRMHIALLSKDEKSEDEEESESEDEEESSDAELEAEWIARKIREKVDNKDTYHKYNREDKTKDEDCVYSWSDFAILIRSNTHLPQYMFALQKYNIPYSTEAYKDLFSDGPVSDIYSYLSVYLNRYDMYSYAAVLHSPFVNLSLEDTQLLIAKKKFAFCNFEKVEKNEKNEKIDKDIKLSDSLLKIYNSARNKFESFCKYADNATLTQVLTYLWYKMGYRYETLKNQTTSMYSYLYDVLFDFARQEENKGGNISSFVRLIAQYKDQNKKLDNIKLPLETDGVHILTIHKSKGLEYPCVFVAGISDRPSSDKSDKVLFSKDYGFVCTVAPDSLYEYEYPNMKSKIRADAYSDSKETNFFCHKGQAVLDRKNKDVAELRRLTYVAFTRAIDQLYLVGHGKLKDIVNTKNYEVISNEIGIIGQVHPSKTKPKDVKITYSSSSNIFKLMLPVLHRYIRQNDDDKSWETENNSPFNLEVFTLEELSQNAEISTQKNVCIHKEVVRELKQYSEDLCSFETPSSLEIDEIELQKSGINKQALENVNPMILEIQKTIFDTGIMQRNDFGTIAHSFMEQAMLPDNLSKSAEEIFPNECEELLAVLDDDKKELVIKTCQKMVSDFRIWFKERFTSPEKLTFVKPEFPFRYFDGHTIIHGTMDLVFEPTPGNYVIIDYKTDEKIAREKYKPQLDAYKEAIKSMFSVKDINIECYLYLLRNGETIKLN